MSGIKMNEMMKHGLYTHLTFHQRIASNIVANKDDEMLFQNRFNAIQKCFNDWTIRSGMPGGANGGLLFVSFLKYVSEFAAELGIKTSVLYPHEGTYRFFPDQMVFRKVMDEYISDIECQLKISGHLLRNFVRDIDLQLVTITLYESLSCLEGISIKGHEGAFLDSLLHQLVRGSDFRKDAMYISPVDQSRWMSALLELKDGETLGDFCAGIGVTSAVAAAGLNVSVYHQEIQPTIAAMNQMLMIMSGFRNCKVICGDSLNVGSMFQEKFDKIICDPPIMQKSDDRLSSKYGMATDGTWGMIYQIIESLKVGGRAVIWLPQSYGFRGGVTAKHREKLVKDGYLKAVINPPPDLVSYTNVRFHIWVLTKPRFGEISNEVYMVDLSDRNNIFYPLEWVGTDDETLLQLLWNTKFQNDTGARMVPVQEIADNGWHLGAQKYLNQPIDFEQFLTDSAALYEQEETLETAVSDLSQRIRKKLENYHNVKNERLSSTTNF